MPTKKDIRRVYRMLRAGADLAGYQLAGLARIDPTTLSKIENGDRQPTPAQRKALAKALRVAVTDLPGGAA